jgi:hypothetical protein
LASRARHFFRMASGFGSNQPMRPDSWSLARSVQAGESLVLDATGTRDPDGDALRYHWFEYTDLNPGYTGIAPLSLQDNTATQVRVTAPRSTVRSQHHVILEVQDTGTPPITRYRRAIVNVEPVP